MLCRFATVSLVRCIDEIESLHAQCSKPQRRAGAMIGTIPTPRSASPASASDPPGAHIGPRLTLLVVDDDPVHRMVVCRAGIRAGFDTVSMAIDEAKAELENRHHDVIALHLSTGGDKAMDVVYRLAAQESGSRLVIIGADDVLRSEAANAAGFLGLQVCASLSSPIDVVQLHRTFDAIGRFPPRV